MDFSTLENELPPQFKSRWESLLDRFRRMESVVVAFSGGVDSGLLCAAAYRALGERMLAVTVRSPVESRGDVESAQRLAGQVGFPLRVVDHDDLSNPEFVSNPTDRCYVCKLFRFQRLRQLAIEAGFAVLVEGSNADDVSDYRPGRKAVAETGTVSPFLELGFGKDEIRALTKAIGLSIWNRPSAPCLATRFPYDSPITHEGLRQVADGERYLHELGFQVVRVRHHGAMVRLEVATDEIERLVAMREDVTAYFKSLGFTYASVDLSGYRLGSLNEVLK
jgi:pyridinium-3,5-biscarboxylic acid mononucleotide sulfurtransferase